jgi:hypothetical protein
MRNPYSTVRNKCLLAVFLLNVCISCSSDIHKIKTKPLAEKNPTSYVFARPVSQAREEIIKAFETENRYSKPTEEFYASFGDTRLWFSVESREDAVFSEKIFQNPVNHNDVYLHSHGEPLGPSQVYFGGGKPLRYRAAFQLHLAALDNNTQVSVITHEPSVINGSKCCGPHGYVSNNVPVEPTTIEEYKILLFVGRILGAREMPPLRLPEEK